MQRETAANQASSPSWDRLDGVLLGAIVLLAGGLRVGYVIQMRACPFFEHEIMDSLYHDQWARAVVEGRTFQEGPYFRAPLYPWFLAGLYELFGGIYLAARLAQAVLGALSCGLVYVIGRLMFSRGVAAVAGFGAATYWALIHFDSELLIPVLIVFLDLVLILMLEWGRRADRLPLWLAAGAALGLSAIAWPLVLLFALPTAAWLLWLYRGRWRRGVAAVLLLTAGCLAPILPVTALNWRAGDPVLIATQGGVNFYIGNNPQSDGATAVVPGTRPDWWGGYRDAVARAAAAAGRKLKGSEVSDYYYREAFRFWREQPLAALKLLARKLALFWSWQEIPNNKDDRFIAERFAPFVQWLPLGFWIVGPLGALGLILSLRDAGRFFPLWGFVLVSMVGVVAFFVTGRYRVPAVPPLLLLAAFALTWIIRAARNRRWIYLAGAGALLIVVGMVGNRTLSGKGFHAAEMLMSMGRVLMEAGQPEAATAYFEEALAREPDNPKAAYSMGLIEDARGNRAGALARYRRAIALDPEYAEAHNNLGALLHSQRDYEAALMHFDAAVRAQPRHAPAHFNRGKTLEALGQSAAALESYRTGLAIDDQNADGWIRAILLAGKAGRSQDALALAERAAQSSERRDARILDLLAEAQYATGRCGDALRTVDEAARAAAAANDADISRQIELHRQSLSERCRTQ